LAFDLVMMGWCHRKSNQIPYISRGKRLEAV
jgi:hypothetical protein